MRNWDNDSGLNADGIIDNGNDTVDPMQTVSKEIDAASASAPIAYSTTLTMAKLPPTAIAASAITTLTAREATTSTTTTAASTSTTTTTTIYITTAGAGTGF